MKLKSKKNKIKVFAFFSVILIVFCSLVTLVAYFFNKPLEIISKDDPEDSSSNNEGASNNDSSNNNYSDYINISLADIIVEKTDVQSLAYYDQSLNQYFFGEINFKNNIATLINKALTLSSDFTDNLKNYSKKIRYRFDDNKSVTINAFIVNNLIKTKKYKSFFKLIIEK